VSHSYYITADLLGGNSGAGKVTENESKALQSVGEISILGRGVLCSVRLSDNIGEPWCWDERAWTSLGGWAGDFTEPYGLAAFYAGTFSKTISLLKEKHYKISYTAAAHDVTVSKEEHLKLGLNYDYPHLTDPDLWKRYVQGYLDADVVVCPSKHSAKCMASYGCENVVVIPHGVDLPVEVPPMPKRFACGYLGSAGSPDKGLRYVLEAWKKLHWDDADLVIAGHDSTSPWVRHLVEKFGGGNVRLLGWMDNISDFYSQISCYVQGSPTEGFGIEVLEALAHGRPVVCSSGAGASDVVSPQCGVVVSSRSSDLIAFGISEFRNDYILSHCGEAAREQAKKYTWDIIRGQYVSLWKSMLGGDDK
jgi:glycosyltransferase involved in cell wall biosynthesis